MDRLRIKVAVGDHRWEGDVGPRAARFGGFVIPLGEANFYHFAASLEGDLLTIEMFPMGDEDEGWNDPPPT